MGGGARRVPESADERGIRRWHYNRLVPDPTPDIPRVAGPSEASNNGPFGLSGSVAGGFIFLTQNVDLPDEATIKIAWSHRYENSSPVPIWSVALYKVQLVVPGVALPVDLWNGADLSAPPVSGGGTTPSYERVEVDISVYRNTNEVGLIFVAQSPDQFTLDLDDIEIYVVPGGGDAVDFTGLTITDAKVKIHKPKKHDKKKKDKDEFEIKKGQLTLGDAFDGFDLLTEDLIITFGDLDPFTIPAGDLHRDKHDRKWQFRGKKPGITHVDIDDKGKFKVKAKGLDLSFIDLKDKDRDPVTFTLTIGDDTGSFDIDFDKKGKFKRKKHHDD